MVKIVDGEKRQLCVENMAFPFELKNADLKKGESREIEYINDVGIVILTKGKLSFEQDNNPESKQFLNKDEVCFINAFAKLKVTAELDTSLSCIIFNPVIVYGYQNCLIQTKYVYPIIKSDKKLFLFSKQEIEKDNTDRMIKTFQSITCLVDKQKDEYELAVKMLLIKLWYLTYKALSIKRDASQESFAKNSKISQAVCFVHDHFGENITLDDIAKECELSKSELCKLFKKYVGQSPMQYLMKYRISSSCYFLLYTSDSIGVIATKIGIDDPNYFAITFKKMMGCTPSEYRKSSFVDEARRNDDLAFISESTIF